VTKRRPGGEKRGKWGGIAVSLKYRWPRLVCCLEITKREREMQWLKASSWFWLSTCPCCMET